MRKASLDAGEPLLAYLKGLLFESLNEPKIYCSIEPETENLMIIKTRKKKKKKKQAKKKKKKKDNDAKTRRRD